jgi:hypothetical protein
MRLRGESKDLLKSEIKKKACEKSYSGRNPQSDTENLVKKVQQTKINNEAGSTHSQISQNTVFIDSIHYIFHGAL